MGVLDRLRSLFGVEKASIDAEKASVEVSAATVLPTPETPKVKNKQQILPSYLTTAKPNPSSRLQLADRRTMNTDLTTLRVQASTRETIRQFVKASPDLSAAVTSYIRTGITNGWTSAAKNPDGTFNPEATSTLHQVLTRMNILNDYTLGYDDSMSIRSLCESWGLQLMTYGAMAGELVLNKARLPDKIQPVSVTQITWYPSSDGKRLIPHQELAGQNIVLDIPTFFMVELDKDLLSPYADSPLESALQPVLFSIDFMNDIRRIVKKAIHPRVDVTIDEEKFRASLPQDVLYDANATQAALAAIISDLQTTVNDLTPEQALVHFDTIGVEVLDHGNTNLSNEYKVIMEMADSKMATGAKVLPVVLGKGGGTANTASAEVLMFMKYVEGAMWSKFNEMLSKILTLAVRLLGHDVYVEFKFDPIDLRPENELEAFRAQKQSRILELLSLGLITDEQASIMLTGQLPPAGYSKMAGTGFRPNTSLEPAGDGFNGASNKGSALNKSRASDAPTGTRGGNKGAEVLPLAREA